MFNFMNQYPTPILKKGSEGTEENKFGFEGGTVIKLDGKYHLFTSEMADEPMWVKMKLAHWVSEDKIHFQRVSTLYTSSGDFTGNDSRAAVWSPMPVYDEKQSHWFMTYIAYHCAPDTDDEWRKNMKGRVWQAKSSIPGKDGIGGPYIDLQIIMEPGEQSDAWEGLQGTDSFFPYQIGDRWYSFYGSARTEKLPIAWWGVGLATAAELTGTWTRCSALNPVLMDDTFVENPVVARLENGTYAAVFDGGPAKEKFGYSVSEDGIHWSKASYIEFTKTWQKHMRTPLCMIPEDDGTFTVYYTAMDQEGYGCIGLVSLKSITQAE